MLPGSRTARPMRFSGDASHLLTGPPGGEFGDALADNCLGVLVELVVVALELVLGDADAEAKAVLHDLHCDRDEIVSQNETSLGKL
eukprot:13505690-Heterocapsa_arctica.AAC.1